MNLIKKFYVLLILILSITYYPIILIFGKVITLNCIFIRRSNYGGYLCLEKFGNSLACFICFQGFGSVLNYQIKFFECIL